MFSAGANKNISIGTATIILKARIIRCERLNGKIRHIYYLQSIGLFYILQTAFKSTDLEEDWI